MKRYISIVAVIGLLSLLVGCPLFQFQLLPRTNPLDPGAWADKYLPDDGFGDRGVARHHDGIVPGAGADNEQAKGIEVYGTDDIFVTGSAVDGSAAEFMTVLRLDGSGFPVNHDGTGSPWIVDTVSGGNTSEGHELAVTLPGEFYVVGNIVLPPSEPTAGVWKFYLGNWDTTFSGDGILRFDETVIPGDYFWSRDLEVLPNGRILVGGTFQAGVSSPWQQGLFLALLNPGNGSFDGGFGGGAGWLEIELEPSNDYREFINDISLHSTGLVIVVGSVERDPGPAFDAYVMLMEPDGSAAYTPLWWSNPDVADGNDRANDAVSDDDGRIYVVGNTTMPDGRVRVFVGRLIWLGSGFERDQAFGDDGFVIIDRVEGGNDWGSSVEIDQMGRVLVAGNITPIEGDPKVDPFIIRLLDNGELDPDFGIEGILTANYSNADQFKDSVWELQIDDDNRMVLAGRTQIAGEDNELTVWRFLNP